MTPSALFVGLAAGLATALLFAGLATQSVGAVGLSLAAPVPIFLASLGWGSIAGFVAAFAAAAGVSVFTGNVASGLTLLASLALAAAAIGHLAGLARPIEEAETHLPRAANDRGGPALDWYPLDRILLATALWAAVGCVFLGWLIGFDPAELTPLLQGALTAQVDAELDPAARQQIGELAQAVVAAVPFAQPALTVFMLVATLHLSASIARASGRFARPKDDIPAKASLPRVALTIFAGGLAGSFIAGPLGQIAAVFAGAAGAAFTLVGLAAFHFRTRGRSGRGLLLFAAYAGIVILYFPVLAFLVLGLVETVRGPAGARRT